MQDNLPIGQSKLSAIGLSITLGKKICAETLDISRATLINYEKGHTEISLGFLEKLKKRYPDFKSKKQNLNQ